MRFYQQQHRHTCGVDLHGRNLYLCILDHEGEIRLHRKLRCDPELFLQAIAPYRDDLVVGAECIFCWYWLADLCTDHGIPFVLGHALGYLRRRARQVVQHPVDPDAGRGVRVVDY